MSARSLQVQHELLAIGFRSTERGLASAMVFAILTAVFVWPKLPPLLTLSWVAVFGAISLVRLSLAQRFLRQPAPVADPARWAARGALAIALTGCAWASIGIAVAVLAPEEPVMLMWVTFLIVLLGVLGAQTTAAHPWIFNAFLFSGLTPLIVTMAFAPSPRPVLRVFAGLTMLAVSFMVGRSGNRYVVQSIEMRYENIELLRDLEAQRQELDQANDAKTRFLAAASHDLRQPMQALVLLVQTLKERVRDPTNQRVAESIHATVDSMSVLLNEILDISKLDAGIVQPRRSAFPIAQLLDRLRSAYTLPAARKELALRVRHSQAIVESDPVLLERILVNLVENALRYTRRGGIVIGCRQRRDAVWIEVWDTGVGIPRDQFGAIFQEFHQLRNPHRDRGQGFGLGLAIVERTSRLLGHKVEVRSHLDRGSVFRVRVPLGDPRRVKAPEPPTLNVALNGVRVLVVDDDSDIRAGMVLLLEGWGCKVHSAANVAEAEALLAGLTGAIDAVVADYRLPGQRTGLDVIRSARELHPRALAILVSGDVSPVVLRAAKEAGVELLHKPLRPARLRALLGEARAVSRPNEAQSA